MSHPIFQLAPYDPAAADLKRLRALDACNQVVERPRVRGNLVEHRTDVRPHVIEEIARQAAVRQLAFYRVLKAARLDKGIKPPFVAPARDVQAPQGGDHVLERLDASMGDFRGIHFNGSLAAVDSGRGARVAGVSESHAGGSTPRLLAALKALLPEIDHEIEQRQSGGLAESWAELQALSNEAHAAVAEAEGRS